MRVHRSELRRLSGNPLWPAWCLADSKHSTNDSEKDEQESKSVNCFFCLRRPEYLPGKCPRSRL